MRRFSFLRNWKFWTVVVILLAGCFIDLERTKAYGIFSLKVCAMIAILAIVGYFMTDKERYQKTVTYNRAGRIVGETDWKFKGYSSPADRDRSNSMGTCLLMAPVIALVIGLLIASLANTTSLLFGFPARYKKPGRPVLSMQSPQEKNRVDHPHGFSFVFPEKWGVYQTENGFRASDTTSNYYNEFVIQTCSPMDTFDLKDSFQGKPARISWFEGNKVLKFLQQQVTFKQDSLWFCLSYSAENYIRKRGPIQKKPIPVVNEYFETFRR